MNTLATFSIARFTLLESWRSRVPLIAAAMLLVAVVTGEFAAGLALTETSVLRHGVYAALARVLMVVLLLLFVASSVLREFDQRLLDLTWSRPVSRAGWYLGRLAGFWGLALLLAVAAAVPLLRDLPASVVAAWALSLGAELALMAAAMLTLMVTLRQLTLAVAVGLGFYLLCRALDAIVLMSRGPTADPNSWVNTVIAGTVDSMALLLPSLDRFTRTAWLLQDALPAGLLQVLGEAAIYSLLLVAVGLFDVYRLDE